MTCKACGHLQMYHFPATNKCLKLVGVEEGEVQEDGTRLEYCKCKEFK